MIDVMRGCRRWEAVSGDRDCFDPTGSGVSNSRMRYTSARIVFQEVPDEISLALLISGCPIGCPGCHSAASWSAQRGEPLDAEKFEKLLERHRRYLTCVLFLGGEWHAEELTRLLDIARRHSLKTCLYTGLEEEEVPAALTARLDYLKVGPYRSDRGGLSSSTTNQKFIDLRNNEVINYRFQHEGGSHDANE